MITIIYFFAIINLIFASKVNILTNFPGECWTTENVCPGNPNKNFYDGCNFCTCSKKMNELKAYCTKISCPPFIGTKQQYEEYCEMKKKEFERKTKKPIS